MANGKILMNKMKANAVQKMGTKADKKHCTKD